MTVEAPKSRPTLAYGLIGLTALVLLWFGPVSGYTSYMRETDQLSQLAERSARYEALARQLPEWRERHSAVTRALAQPRPLFLTAKNRNLAVAELQRLVTDRFSKAGLKVQRARSAPSNTASAETDAPATVSIRITLTADYAALVAGLKALEGNAPALLVPSLTLEPILTNGARRRPDPRRVSAQMTVTALFQESEG